MTALLALALLAAQAGDTIRLAAGVHLGPLLLERPVVLLGEPGAVLDGRGRGTVITVRADTVNIQGLINRNGGT